MYNMPYLRRMNMTAVHCTYHACIYILHTYYNYDNTNNIAITIIR